jgi:hypothetical protein
LYFGFRCLWNIDESCRCLCAAGALHLVNQQKEKEEINQTTSCISGFVRPSTG